ncbi:unnamed protein product [Schistocephalus solidus]|uniref:phenylalanine--tRNA ligase n=1 Tax=Schistocephalus solidus TaxID=70667 RepID=A0A183TD04_SCHSO|nr:unnamed protein product [Schistocephalus solidus]
MDVSQKLLQLLARVDSITSADAATSLKIDHQTVVGGINSLLQSEGLIEADPVVQTEFTLTDEGQHVLTHGSHEFVVYSSVPEDGIAMTELMKVSPYAKVGVSKALASKWIRVTKTPENTQIVTKAVSFSVYLRPCSEKSELKKRKLITEKNGSYLRNDLNVRLYVSQVRAMHTELVFFLPLSGSWQECKFKKYNFNALGVPQPMGHLHPLLRVRAEFRRILMDMGFSEMPTNNYVESSFWNFDTLFQPQHHPARDAHDTFFLSDPATTDVKTHCPTDYLNRVKTVHETGGFGSTGYRYNWQLSEAEKNILRTHTTAVTSRMLYLLAQQFTPVRYFSIDRVFRNETLDATHLAEFHQVEGVVADYGLCLGHLKAVIRAFFNQLGLSKLRFKPAYNPYTEPSMEIFSYHPGLGKWVEVGNSGIFRPEMLRPMGLPEGVTAIAWGLSLERPTMIRYGYKNIRDLMGPKIDLRMVYDSPLCRLEKF